MLRIKTQLATEWKCIRYKEQRLEGNLCFQKKTIKYIKSYYVDSPAESI